MSSIEVYRADLQKSAQHFAAAVPAVARKYLTPDRIVRVTLNAMAKSPMLLKANRKSLLLAVMEIAQLGLEPGGPLGHAYLVPFRDKRAGTTNVTPIIGYKGYIALAMRSGLFTSAPYVHLVHERDDFFFDRGAGGRPRHVVPIGATVEQRGARVGGYCVAEFTGGGVHVEPMSWEQIMGIKARSMSARSESSPWHTDEDQMARKTVLRRAKNYWPLDNPPPELGDAFDLDDRVDAGDVPMGSIDAAFGEVLAATPETTDAEPPADGGKLDQLAGQIGATK